MAVVPTFHSALPSAQINTADGRCSSISFGTAFSSDQHCRWLLFQHFIRHQLQLRSTLQMAVVPTFHSALASAQINTADGCCSSISFGIGFSSDQHCRWLLFQHFIRHWLQLRSTLQMAVVPTFHSALASAEINTADGCCSNISFGIGFSSDQHCRWLLFQHFIRNWLQLTSIMQMAFAPTFQSAAVKMILT